LRTPGFVSVGKSLAPLRAGDDWHWAFSRVMGGWIVPSRAGNDAFGGIIDRLGF
jgi:hypothetical protein